MIPKRMGVMNITPNSFSDGGEFFSSQAIEKRLHFLKDFDAIDIGAESTAPTNSAITCEEEWERWQMVLPFLKALNLPISADTYHPKTIFRLLKYWQDHHFNCPLIWNDVSGKIDDSVKEFLKTGFDYIFCHNLAPSRELSGEHMKYVQDDLDLTTYFEGFSHPQIIFDPCLGFSKTCEQNWQIIDSFGELQKKVHHSRWLLGFSRKSFLRKKYGTQIREELDILHTQELKKILPSCSGELWIRTHRPELV